MLLYHASNQEVAQPKIVNRFKVKQLFDQVLFCNERTLALLAHLESTVVEVGS